MNLDGNAANGGLILDYADYVELACEEENGVYRNAPSCADVLRSAYRFIDSARYPPDPLHVTREEHNRAYSLWTDFDRSRTELFGQWNYHHKCPYCGFEVQSLKQPGDDRNKFIESVYLAFCANCGWWESDENGWPDQDGGRSVHRRAILREFSIAGHETPVESLHSFVLRHPNALHQISPRNLEKLVGSVFAEFMNCEAIHVGGPNDDGIDLVLVDGVRRYVVQVKRRQSPVKSEAVSLTREFIGAMVLDGTLRGLFVSTAPRFSKKAEATARKAEKMGSVERIELIDSSRLIEICNLMSSQPSSPWQRAASKPEDFINHVVPGFSKFLELAMGDSKWKVVN